MLRSKFTLYLVIIVVSSTIVTCKNNGLSVKKKIVHFPVKFHFVDTNDTTMMAFEMHAGVYFPKQDSSTYSYTAEAAPGNPTTGGYIGKYLVGHVLSDSITGKHSIRRPYVGCQAGMVILAKKFWHGNTGNNVPTWRAWHLKERTINDPDSNVVSFKWPQDTLSPNVEYIGYVKQ